MKAIIIGAGATIEESYRSSGSREFEFPLISNFAKVMWREYLPHPFLHPFLAYKGMVVDPTGNASLEQFLELERLQRANVEEFFEFCWHMRLNFPDHQSAWHDMQMHGFLLPITTAMITQFFDNGSDWRRLNAGALVCATLAPGDLVVNLNYDTVFEIAIEQNGKGVSYLPNRIPGHVLVAKPHGSVNLLVTEKSQSFCFGEPRIHGTAVPAVEDSLAASILPPRLNKHYSQHPISRTIIEATYNFAPSELIFWGVGLTQSDVDLNALYYRLAMTSDFITVINPDRSTAALVSEVTRRSVIFFASLDSWVQSRGLGLQISKKDG